MQSNVKNKENLWNKYVLNKKVFFIIILFIISIIIYKHVFGILHTKKIN